MRYWNKLILFVSHFILKKKKKKVKSIYVVFIIIYLVVKPGSQVSEQVKLSNTPHPDWLMDQTRSRRN